MGEVAGFFGHWPGLTAFLLLVLATLTRADDWQSGRATMYGDEPWAWSIHDGSCHHDYIWPDQWTGYDVAALSDRFPGYSGSCDRCYEVKCDPRHLSDGYGQSLDRTNVCRDSEASVVVRVTDTCPCWYPNNQYSNKRWCCGDTPHMDLSVWAFGKLAELKWGVISIKYSPVDCGHQPWKQAYGDSVLPVFPAPWQAKQRKDFDFWKWFPKGGLRSPQAGECKAISTQEFMSSL